MKEIYFDNSATSRCTESVINIMCSTMRNAYGNPSSLHHKGVEAEDYCKKAAETFADIFKCSSKEILFTSGGTESNNLAIKGVAEAYKRTGNHIITSAVEHPSVLNCMRQLEKEGYSITYLPVDKKGRVIPEYYENALQSDTILTSIMTVNNEIGTRQPIEILTKIKKEKAPNSIFHTDAVQGFSRYEMHAGRLGVDLISISGHKFHGPKGIGVLYIRNGVRIISQMLGGGQQNDIRSGTYNVSGIAGIGVAAYEAYDNFNKKIRDLYIKKQRLTDGLKRIAGVKIIGPTYEEGAAHIIAASFPPVRSEVLLHSLEEREIYVSSGSACSSHKAGYSDTIKAIGLDKAEAYSTIRFSLSDYNTNEEIDYCLDVLNEILPNLKKYSRK